jgi:hypothetical protein
VTSSTPLPAPSPELRARVLAAVALEPVESRVAGERRRSRSLAIGFGSTVAVLALIGGPHARGRPVAFVALLVGTWLGIAVLATWGGVARGRSMLGRPVSWRLAVALATPLALWASWAAVAVGWPETLADPSGPVDHAICNGLTLAFALGPMIAFGRIRRATDPVSPRVSAAAIGAAAAAWGAVVQVAVCGHTSPRHMLAGHVLPVVLVTVLSLAMTRMVAIRAKTG